MNKETTEAEHPAFDKPAFTKKHLEDPADIIAIRLNTVEREKLIVVKDDLNLPSDSTTLKLAYDIGLNVLYNLVGKETLRYLTSERRVRKRGSK